MVLPTFTHTVPVAATPEALWSLVRDVHRVAELFPFNVISNFTSLPSCWEFHRQLKIPHFTDLHWDERAWVAGEGALCFQAIAGDLSEFAGSWQVAPQGEAAQLTLQVEYAIPEHLAGLASPALAAYVLGELFTTICRKVKAAAEEAA
jgi:ribosome-associated toxin RatA of RatAB toxin-antitoxin module